MKRKKVSLLYLEAKNSILTEYIHVYQKQVKYLSKIYEFND